MAIHESTPLLTYEDYLHFPEDGQRHEILGGEHFVTAAPFLRHQKLSALLTYYFVAALRSNRVGEIFAAPTDVLLSPHDIVQPDLVYVSSQRVSVAEDKNLQGAPDLVIEILSASTRRLDEGLKLRAYERFGVREYWIFDPEAKTAQVWERTGEVLHRKAQFSAAAGDILMTPLLPGLEIPLAEVFGEEE
jgi:Uma2 family endonuclease